MSSGFPPQPLTDKAANLAHAFIGTTLALELVSTLVLGARIYTRIRPVWRLTADDYFICAGYCFVTAAFAMLFRSVRWAWGMKHPPTLTIEYTENSFMLGTLAEPVWAWSMGLIKISIACMLLRFQQSRNWRSLLFVLIGVQSLLIVGNTFANLLQCIPLEAAWDFQGRIKHKTCWSTHSYKVTTTTTGSINVATDIIFSIMPITFLRKIRRPLPEKILIGFLMALGLIASGASLWKTVLAQDYNNTTDYIAQGITFGLMSCVEEQLSLIAACIPCLRSPVQRALTRVKILHQKGRTTRCLNYGEGSSLSGGPKGWRKRMVYLQNWDRPNMDVVSTGGPTDLRSPKEQDLNRTMSDTIEPCSTRDVLTPDPDQKNVSSVSELREEWSESPGSIMRDEWHDQRKVGAAV